MGGRGPSPWIGYLMHLLVLALIVTSIANLF
jgi:hypothetical protein